MTPFVLAEIPSLNRHAWHCHSKSWWPQAASARKGAVDRKPFRLLSQEWLSFRGPPYLGSFLLACAHSKIRNLEKNNCTRDPKVDKASREPKELSTNNSALCLLQDPYLRPQRDNY